MPAADSSIAIWVFGSLLFVLGLVLGCIVAYLVIGRQSRTRELQDELITLREKFSDYRDQVTQHFMRTSELVQEMTFSYRAVYEHLAAGAQNLCSGGLEAPQANLPGTAGTPAGGGATAPHADGQTEADAYLDGVLGDTPRISDLDIPAKAEEEARTQH